MQHSRKILSLFISIICLPLVMANAQDVHVHVSPSSKGSAANSDDFRTIQMAMDHAADPGAGGRLFLHISPGVYKERVIITPNRARTTFLGASADPSSVVITSAQNATTSQSTFFSETVEVNAPEFQADNITFENTAGQTGQALAISVNADRAVFKHCRFLGFQDTVFANYGRQYYVDSYISGGVDFIFGNATAFFEHVEVHSMRAGFLTAQSRTSATQTTGYVFDHSRITSSDTSGQPFSLGRPWRRFSRVVFLNTEMPDNLTPQGWSAWNKGDDPRDVFYAERGSTGPGARIASRVKWSHQLSAEEAAKFTTTAFLGGSDSWDAPAEAARLP